MTKHNPNPNAPRCHDCDGPLGDKPVCEGCLYLERAEACDKGFDEGHVEGAEDLADVILDVERGIRTWPEVVDLARRTIDEASAPVLVEAPS